LDSTEEQIIEEAEKASPEPIEVKIINQPKKEASDYDSVDDLEYDELGVTTEQVEEFENGDSSSK